MSKPSLQTIILGGFAYFVEAGLTDVSWKDLAGGAVALHVGTVP